MKKSKFNETKILTILKESEAGMSVAEISRKYGISNATFYNWKNKYAGMSGSEIRRIRITSYNVCYTKLLRCRYERF